MLLLPKSYEIVESMFHLGLTSRTVQRISKTKLLRGWKIEFASRKGLLISDKSSAQRSQIGRVMLLRAVVFFVDPAHDQVNFQFL